MRTLGNKSKLTAFGAATLLAVAFALIVGAFTTQQAVAQTPNSSHPFAVGGFTPMDMSGITHVAFAAQQNPTKTTTYSGHVVQETTAGVRSGPVQCLAVGTNSATSNTARVVWKVNQSNIPGDSTGVLRSFDVMDNGQPVMGMSPDMYRDNGTNNTTCPASIDNSGTYEPLVNGNIVVSSP